MALTVKLPRNFNVQTMYQVIGAVIDPDQKLPRDQVINFDFSNVAFAEPAGMTAQSNLMEWLIKRGVHGNFIEMDPKSKAIKYIDDCGFFAEYTGRPLSDDAEARNTTIPFGKVLCENSHAWLDLTVFPWLAARLSTNTASLAEFKACLREVFQNIKDHSTEDIGCIHIQYFPASHEVKISISDFGVGIPTELSKAYPGMTDAEAIALAVQEGISSKSGGHNKGAGLTYLIDNVVGRNCGFVGIYSNGGKLECRSLPKGKIHRSANLVRGFYPGTLISIGLRTDRIERAEREDMRW
jgi:anti-sigma regulatory factor (Ser/Thr protein kinase)